MKKKIFETIIVVTITTLIELLLNTIFKFKSIKQIIIALVFSLIISIIVYSTAYGLFYKLKLLLKPQNLIAEKKAEFVKHYEELYALRNNVKCNSYLDVREITHIKEHVDFLCVLISSPFGTYPRDEFQIELIECITPECIVDYLNVCKVLLSKYSNESETVEVLYEKINHTEIQLELFKIEK